MQNKAMQCMQLVYDSIKTAHIADYTIQKATIANSIGNAGGRHQYQLTLAGTEAELLLLLVLLLL